MSDSTDIISRLLAQVYGSGAIPGFFGRSAADYVGRRVAGQSQEIGQRGVEFGPPASAAEPAVTARAGSTAYGPDLPLPIPPRPGGRTAPVATPSAPTGDPDSASSAENAVNMLRNLQGPTAQDPTAGRDFNDRLANFGYAMAASRNPSLFGMIGEAGLAMQRGDREARQDTRQEREVDVMSEYRRAQIELGRAEAEWNRDPNNPLNVARLAEARYRLAAAANAGRSGSGSSEGQGIPIEREDGTFGVFYPRTGRIATAPEGVRPMGATANTPEQRRLTDWNNRRAAFEERLFQNPLFGTQQARDAAMREWVARNPMPTVRGSGTGTGTGTRDILPPAPTEGDNRVRIPYTPPGR